MKRVLMSATALLASVAYAQNPAVTESKTIAGKTISIKYAAPSVRGRVGKLFGKDGTIGQDQTYPVWRAGADSATAFHTDADLDLGGLAVPKGDYTLFVDLSDPNNWVLIVNRQTGQWGLTYDKSRDLGRVKMTMSKPPAPVEQLKYTITDGKITLAWENHAGSVNFKVK